MLRDHDRQSSDKIAISYMYYAHLFTFQRIVLEFKPVSDTLHGEPYSQYIWNWNYN